MRWTAEGAPGGPSSAGDEEPDRPDCRRSREAAAFLGGTAAVGYALMAYTAAAWWTEGGPLSPVTLVIMFGWPSAVLGSAGYVWRTGQGDRGPPREVLLHGRTRLPPREGHYLALGCAVLMSVGIAAIPAAAGSYLVSGPGTEAPSLFVLAAFLLLPFLILLLRTGRYVVVDGAGRRVSPPTALPRRHLRLLSVARLESYALFLSIADRTTPMGVLVRTQDGREIRYWDAQTPGVVDALTELLAGNGVPEGSPVQRGLSRPTAQGKVLAALAILTTFLWGIIFDLAYLAWVHPSRVKLLSDEHFFFVALTTVAVSLGLWRTWPRRPEGQERR